jgi:hypothetical protein
MQLSIDCVCNRVKAFNISHDNIANDLKITVLFMVCKDIAPYFCEAFSLTYGRQGRFANRPCCVTHNSNQSYWLALVLNLSS